MSDTTADYGGWISADPTNQTMEGSLAVALGSFGGDYDIAAIAKEWREAINEALPEGFSLNGNNFYGPYPKKVIDLKTIVDTVDLWSIVHRNAK